jgi:queuine tRNA-ribosyltransferase
MSFFNLELTANDCKARTGTITTGHSIIKTPVFMPVGTQGAVKALEQRELLEMDTSIILGNTYHLYLRPGTDVISHFGGLHKFINWGNSILTDSGGYQVFSLQELRKLKEGGVEFRSHIDGSKHFFSPEKVVEIQRILGSDIVMVLDECTSYPSEYHEAKKSMDLSLKWAKASKTAFDNSEPEYEHEQFLFSIGQGSMYPDLRKEYLENVIETGFDGYAIGGLSVGEPAEKMYEITDLSTIFYRRTSQDT